MKTKIIIGQLLFILLFASCEYQFPDSELPTTQDLGEINAENIIAVGDGYLAGAMDGALYSAGQQNSVAAIFASQIENITETSFLQPDINSENGFNFYASSENELFGKWLYLYKNQTDEFPGVILTPGQNVQEFTGDKGLLNNLAVPMLSVENLSMLPSGNNPYVSRVFGNSTKNITEQIVERAPTFVLCWLGMNDYLNFAMNGAVNADELTSAEVFQDNFSMFVNEIIQQTDSKILIGNLVSIEDLPYFYMKQYNFIRLTNQEKGVANTRYSSYNQGVTAYNIGLPLDQMRPYISFEDNGAALYPQPLVVIDNTMPDAFYPDGSPMENYRQLTEGEMALMSITDEMIEAGYGSTIPLTDEYYLSADQKNLIAERYNSFNRVIKNICDQHPSRIALVDIQQKVNEIADTGKSDAWGIVVSNEIIDADGVPLEGGLDMNSIFSLDGVHFNQRGNAFITNIMLRKLNTTFNSNIQEVGINDFVGNVYTFSY
jgi:hypothetical protein